MGNNSTTYGQVGRLLPNLPQPEVWRPPPAAAAAAASDDAHDHQGHHAYCGETDANPVSVIGRKSTASGERPVSERN
jgi:hypothetical protein